MQQTITGTRKKYEIEDIVKSLKKESKELKKFCTDFNMFLNLSERFYERNSISLYNTDPTKAQEEFENNWKYHLKPVLVISMTNNVIENFITSKRIFNEFDIRELGNFEKAVKKMYSYYMQKETRRWKTHIKKEAVLHKIPVVVLKKISPNIGNIQESAGVFDLD